MLTENRADKLDGVGIPKKRRSLDLKSLYSSDRNGKTKNNKRNDCLERGNNVNKKINKQKYCSDLEGHVDKKSRKCVDAELSKKLNCVGISLDGEGLRIPKGKRAQRRKFVGGVSVELPAGVSGSKVDLVKICVEEKDKLVGNSSVHLGNGNCNAEESAATAESPNFKEQKGNDDQKENKSTSSSLKFVEQKGNDGQKENKSHRSHSCDAKVKDENSTVHANGSFSVKKEGKKQNRPKNSAVCRPSSVDEAEPSTEQVIRRKNGAVADDEDNLEQNAARMLSSRFDPSCIGFSLERKVDIALSENGLSPLMFSGLDVVSHHRGCLGGSDSISADGTVRILRPRKDLEGKSLSRKRRHFYEMFAQDFDPYWVLNRRIKVFWPLDKSWYYGLVKAYDPDRKQHHVKYDDRDEEWINLENERFKLLLFPREVPSSKERRSAIRDRSAEGRKRDLAPEDSSYASSYMESEPISSWLSRSSRRVKSTPIALKKQKISEFPIAQPADDIINLNGALDIASSRVFSDQVSVVAALAPELSHDLGDGTSVLENKSSLKDSSGPIVYYRRRRGGETCNESGCKNVIKSSATSFTSLLPIDESSWTWESFDVSGGQSDREWPFWFLGGSQLLKLVIPGSTWLRVHPSFLVLSVRNFLRVVGDLWLLNAYYLLQHGVICTMWPNVQLEMLFVDNISGLRFFVLEGCMEQAVTFIFLVLEVFHRSHEKGKCYDLRRPVTIVTFRLALAQDRRRQLVFAFCSYSEVKNSEWVSLDFKLRRHCTLKKQLSVSECTYDNIRALERRSEGMLITSPNEESFSSQVVEKTSKQDSLCMGLYKGPACEGINQFSGVKNPGPLPPFALSFSASPTFFLGLHLKLLMGRAVSHVHILNDDSIPLFSRDENSPRSLPDVSSVEDCPKEIPVINVGSNRSRTCLRIQSESLVCLEQELGNAPIASSSNGDLKNLHSVGNHKPGNTCHDFQGPLQPKASAIVQVFEQPSYIPDGDQTSSGALLAGDNFLLSKSDPGNPPPPFSGISVEIPRFEPAENIGRGSRRTTRLPNVAWNTNDSVLDSPDRTTTRSMWQRSRHDINSSLKLSSPVWPDGNAELYGNGFGSGPKKPRTQVSYTVPIGDIDFSSKQRNLHHRGMSHKRIRRAIEKRSMDSSRSLHKQSELLICLANVLITHGDKGWREWGAQIALELDHNEWKLVVKNSETTRYLYKAHQFLHPGSTNRYTHAMMWKGGKDWSLEFTDRSQWTIFKEMHEECYNRNLRAASVKNIPIPGVHVVEENDDNVLEVAFFRSSPRYISQGESDIEMALNPSHILYDMDSDDEQWLLEHRDSFQIYDGEVEDSEELFEKSMDLLEKVAYTEKDDEFTHQEIEELFSGLGPIDTMKKIYDYWWQKRQRKGMPLIRQLQPPLWEIYEQQLKEWELTVSRKNNGFSNGSHEKFVPAEKPPMFAFCMKPRGLEIPNKGSKQRSHRRYSAGGKNHISGDHDVYHASGRRSNGSVWGDDYVVSPGNSHESLEFSPFLPTPRRIFSPRGASSKAYFSMNDLLERNHYPNLHRNKAKRMGILPSSSDPYSVSLYNQGKMPRSNGVQQSDMTFPEWPAYKNHQSEMTQRLLIEQLDSPDLDEFRLRDASGAAKHARNMARLKKEKAQRSLYRADLAIHKAVVALMNAEALKASLEDPAARDGTE